MTTEDQLRREPFRPVRAAQLLTAGLVVSTVALLMLVLRDEGPVAPAPHSGVVVFGLVVAGFVVAEWLLFQLEYRRETLAFTLSEVPLAFALVYLSPVAAVLAQLLAGLGSTALSRPRPRPLKVVFNLALYSFETAFAATILRQMVDGDGTSDQPARLILAVAITLFATTITGWLLVSVAVSFFESGFLARLPGQLRAGRVVYLLGPAIGVVAVAVSYREAWLTPLPLLLILGFWALVRSNGQLAQDHRDLIEVQRFTGAVVRSLVLEDIAGAAVDEIRRMLRAEHCALIVLEPRGLGRRRIVGSPALRRAALALEAEREAWATEIGSPVVLGPAESERLGADGLGINELVVTCVGDGRGPLALLLVANREGAHDRFSPADLSRLASLAGQLAAALRNGLMHEQIEHEASHDRLTGLPNRSQLERLAAAALAERPVDEVVAVLMVDLDRFKEVNDTLGHHVGDRLLVAFSDRVAALLQRGDVLGRFAGDEFAVLVRRRDAEQLTALAVSLVSALRQPFDLGELSVVVTGSIGVAYAPADGDDVMTLLRRADIAMYEAKSRHTGWEAYRSDIDRSGANHLALHGELRTLLERRQLEVHFQPKVDLATSTIVGVEALARWNHPTRGYVAPDEFIALAEQTGLIHQLTDQVLSAALAAARHWQRRGAALSVAVNLSAHNLLDELLPDRVSRLLEHYGVEPYQLTLEITESSVMSEAARTLATLDRLRQLQVNLSVDDFGTGYSSLNYLRRLPVSEVKIDRSFVAELLLVDQDEVIVRSTVDLGHNLGLQVVAEGVENEPVMARLRELGCDLAQGYGISRPLPLDKFDAWLRTAPYAVRRSAGWDPAHVDLS